MNPPSEHQSARMRHLREEDNSLVFPRRPVDPTTLDVDSSRHARVFSEDVMSGIDNSDSATTKASQARARLMFVAGIGCFIFLLITLSFYSNLSSQENLSVRDAYVDNTEDVALEYDSGGEGEVLDLDAMENTENQLVTASLQVDLNSRIIPGHVTEGGDVINSGGPTDQEDESFGDNLIIPELESVEENIESDTAVITSQEDMEELANSLGAGGDLFILDINGIRFEVGIGSDGDMDLPPGLVLNPHVRQHWGLIQTVLGFDDYDYGYDVPRDEEGTDKLELDIENRDMENDDVQIETEEIDGKAVRMPEGLLFDAPSIDETNHVHGKDCDPVSIEIPEEGVVEPEVREVARDLDGIEK